jgi:ABC-2 type transport system ATP-binding protein
MIEIQDLVRRYGATVAVDGVTTRIGRGEIVGLLGHNGAGKTTVMKILTGYLEPTSGTVTVAGHDAHADRIEVQRRIGYLPENAPLYEELRVQEYLEMMAELRGVPAAEIPARVAEAVLATGLRDRLAAPIHTLSKGLRQRVGIAQAILHHPDVLVLDEPTNGLDPVQIQAIRQLVKRLGERTTILLSTHILQEIEAVCDRVLIMIQGHLVADAPLAELLGARRIRLVVSGEGEVKAAVGKVPGITDVVAAPAPAAAGEHAWMLAWSGGEPPVAEVADAVKAAGLTLRAIAPEVRTLDAVFQELQAAHAAGGAA